MRAAAVVVLVTAIASAPVAAQWTVVTETPEGNPSRATLARIRNDAGYTLALYRDGGGAIRARFTLPEGLIRFEDGHCPTLQVDRWAPGNRSVNDAACLASGRWAEFIVGYIRDGAVQSARLLQIMNGNEAVLRFRLAGGDYRETSFSLAGSKRSLSAAIGADVVVTAR